MLAGTFLCRYNGATRNAEGHAAACASGRTSLEYVWGLDDSWILDAESPERSSWARYINHSRRRQNVGHVFVSLPPWVQSLLAPLNVPTDPYAVWFEAKRDMTAGEELLVDYGTSYWDATICVEWHKRLPKGAPLWRLHPDRLQVDWG